ncbi:sugar ABC transporter substrate-binding protein [Bacillus sp. FJAT-50079]|uniref:ABC transporter substrate-binding protein n=1 Tax=Bacillus sp. FJAT-50079 TaxID=2833577 RepID=UPI001BC8FA12|nr:sugar ABC transporter substrate-binding protein [Bacillus sp. FJAT-50079]MBS4206873.1 sugar ABC transporter substrate-binding protein [Bacillus sp. FJAT-50079]
MRKKLNLVAVLTLVMSLLLAACGGGTASNSNNENGEKKPEQNETASKSKDTLTIATVNNPDMQIMQKMTKDFEAETGIEVKFVVLPENELRKKVTEDVALGAGQFDIVTIGTYDTPIWAENGWIESLHPFFESLTDEEKNEYDIEDIFTAVKNALSYDEELYALPFYAESSMLYYNIEMFEKAGLEMPERPTWDEVADLAVKVQEANDVPGIIIRGLPGWGEMMAPLGTIINAFGGSWYDMDWNAQLSSPETKEAIQFYVDLLGKAGQSGATTTGFTEALTLMSTEKAAMWYDATVAAGFLNSSNTQVAGKIGYAFAPSQKKDNNGWLWAWSLAIESASKNKESAFEFIKWATSKEYIEKVGESEGWVVAPSGTRASTYDNPKYQEAAPFSDMVLRSLENADYENPTLNPVPYKGVQYVAIPEFQQLGTEVSQEIAAALAGQKTVDEAMDASQKLAEKVAEEGGYK